MKKLIQKLVSRKASISLISLIIISAFTLILVIAMSDASISSSLQYFNNESNTKAYYLAEACLEEATYRLESDANFLGTTVIFDTDSNCTISVNGVGPIFVDISVSYLDYVQNYQAEMTYNSTGEIRNYELVNWEKTL